MATNPQDILGKGIKIEQLEIPFLGPLEARIYEVLTRDSLSIDEIAINVNESVIDITISLTMMGLKEIVNEMGGKFYIAK